ncbi:MAG: T9SS type A sorting domain-containing protein [Bacteroidia bacterium]|nr:T9SS type A sorting domain-containing protein [Bacteroidia bacterium]
MKKNFKYVLLLLVTVLTVQAKAGKRTAGVERSAGEWFSGKEDLYTVPLNQVTIDSTDTIYFDMSGLLYTGTHVELPVYFNSDDPVYSFDFSLRFDQSKMMYDTITLAPAAAGYQAASYLNPNDSIVRLTSNHLVAMPVLTPIVYIHFDMLNGAVLDSNDIFTLKGYLNGDACSESIVAPQTTGVHEMLSAHLVKLFPNPVTEYLTIQSEVDATADLFDACGKRYWSDLRIQGGRSVQVNLSGFPAGFYMIRLTSDDGSVYSEKILLR